MNILLHTIMLSTLALSTELAEMTDYQNETKGNDNNELCLWYHRPADNWNSAMPLGNGRISTMVFGHPVCE